MRTLTCYVLAYAHPRTMMMTTNQILTVCFITVYYPPECHEVLQQA